MREGVDGLLRDKTRPPGKPRTSEAKVREVAELARSSAPEGETHWTVRALAKTVGLSPTTVHKILVRHRLAPHKVRQFKVSTDPDFAEKTRSHRVVHESAGPGGGSLDRREDADPGARADLEGTADEEPGRPATMTHENKRNGTTTLFAAPDILDGTAVGSRSDRRRPTKRVPNDSDKPLAHASRNSASCDGLCLQGRKDPRPLNTPLFRALSVQNKQDAFRLS